MNYKTLITKNNTLKGWNSPIITLPKSRISERSKCFELGLKTNGSEFEKLLERLFKNGHSTKKITSGGSSEQELQDAFDLGFNFAEDNYDLLHDLEKAQEEVEGCQEWFDSCNPKSRTGLDAHESLSEAQWKVEKILEKLNKVIEGE